MRPEEESQGPVIRDRRRIDPATGQVRDSREADQQRGSVPGGGQHRPGRHSVSRPGTTAAASGSGGGAGSQPRPGSQQRTGGAAAQVPGSGNGGGAPAGPGGSAGASEGGSEAADRAAEQARVMLAERTADLQRLQAEYANYRKRVERDRIAVREQALANVLQSLLPVLDDIGRAREHGELTGAFKSVGESLEGVASKLGLTPFGESGDPFDPTLHEALMHSYSADVTEPTAVQILQPGYKVGERIIRPARVAVAEPADDALARSGGAAADLGGTVGSDGSAASTAAGEGANGGTGEARPGADTTDDNGANGTGKE
jgi:molecular chaperone GrpE